MRRHSADNRSMSASLVVGPKLTRITVTQAISMSAAKALMERD
jgi:hypothetical protein